MNIIDFNSVQCQLNVKLMSKVLEPAGVEPVTSQSALRCSTTEL